MRSSESINELAAALVKAQASFPEIPRDRIVEVKTQKGAYGFAYAPLDTILACVRPVLAANQLAITFGMADGAKAVTTRLIHVSGQWHEHDVPIVDARGMQDLGSAITYAKRYGLEMSLGITATFDDDGNRADGNQVLTYQPEPKPDRATDDELMELEALLSDHPRAKAITESLWKQYSVDKLAALPRVAVVGSIKAIKQKAKKQNG